MANMSRGSAPKGGKPSKSASKVVKHQKVAKGTPSSRRHHFEGFSQRIAKLKIDPIRRTRRAIGAEGSHDLEKESSYFRTALDEWKDINLSEHFTAFAKEVYPISESLAMTLHYEDRIMDLLMSYIAKGTSLSLEPLLALLSHLAHDLDVRFEKHFQKSVAIVTEVAAKDADAESIEWCFTCLAWLFKYLSRLLVPDLRPLYDLMAPFLGKRRQKPFIIRFAAEAMSFLVRKAGSAYQKNKAPLDSIVAHMLRDHAASTAAAPNELYAQGLMTLFTESIKGIQGTLHSGGNAVLRCLTSFCFDADHDLALKSSSLRILKGSLISVIHHTDVETFEPILDAILEMTDFADGADALDNLDAASMLLFTVAATRQGSRVREWPTIIRRAAGLVKRVDKASTLPDPVTMTEVLNALAVVLNYAPIDAVLPEIAIFDTISRGKWKGHFLPFCNLVAELDLERFRGLLLAHFQRFITNNWQENEESLCALIPALHREGIFARSPLQCPSSWQNNMLDHFKSALGTSSADRTGDDKLLPMCNGELSVLRATQGDKQSRNLISVQLLEMIKGATQGGHTGMNQWDLFALAQGFQYVADVSPEMLHSEELLKALCSSSSRAKGLAPYWQALNQVLQASESLDLNLHWLQEFKAEVIECLDAPSHDLRLIGLEILKTLYVKGQQDVPDLLTVALSIEDTPPTVQTARFISSQIRRLALSYSTVLSDSGLAKAIPTYCFGLMHVQLSQAWDDAILALKEMAQHDQAEKVIFEITSGWLKGSSDADLASETDFHQIDRQISHVSSDFECSNLLQIEKLVEVSSAPFHEPEVSLQRMFESQHRTAHVSALSNRAQALRALNGMPQLAEKHSRTLVPVLLEWSGNDNDVGDDAGDKAEGERWGRKDQKAMLNIFAQFQNPRVLFKTAEVRQALLNLVCNGDADIQKSALKALMAWKTPSVIKYQEHLFNILDDARFREEVSVFLRLDQEGDAIRSDDCPELMPVLLRLLYGKAVARAGSASGKRGQQTRRKAIFVALARFPDSVLQQFLEITLGSLSGMELIVDGSLNAQALEEFSFAQRRQVGLLNMLEDMLQTLGDRLSAFATVIADAVLLCLLKISKTSGSEVGEDAADEQHTSLDRAIRQAGFHCLNELFASCTSISWHDHAAVIMKELVKPRLDKLPVETAQSVSGTLRLFSTWSSYLSTCNFLTDFYPEILSVVADCLAVPSAKYEVKMFIVEKIIGRLLDTIEPRKKDNSTNSLDQIKAQEDARKSVLAPNASLFVVRLGGVLRQSPPKDLLDASVLCVSRLAPLVSGASNIRDVIEVSIFLLGQPPRVVHYTTKRDLLQTLSHLIPAADLKSDEKTLDQVYTTLFPLFSFFKDRESRTLLSAVVNQLSAYDDELAEVAPLCDDLNSFSTSRLDEPDFERRSGAFNIINEGRYKEFSARQWQPLIYNMLFYIKDNDELAIRTNASYSLRRFIEASSHQNTFKNDGFEDLVSNGLWPSLQYGVREESELVRVEFLNVTAHLIKHLSSWSAVSDMHSLLVDSDEEASFFVNILHIQQHRRLRALRRLADEAKKGVISSVNVSSLFIPLLEHFIFDPSSDEASHNLAAETINSVGALSGCLEWAQYRGTLRRFVGYVKSKQELQKTVLRLVSAVIDALDHAAQSIQDKHSEGVAGESDSMEVDNIPTKGKLTTTLPAPDKLASEINKQFLPPLTDFLHLKDESTVSLRVPVAISVVKLIRVLPAEEHAARLPSVLMDLCHILRSKAAESRDMTRKTLSTIMRILGASYFGYILKELRSALQRGYQLHVLSFTVHSLIVDNVNTLNAGDLDYCVPDLVSIIMDDIFGAVGQEKDAEEYISKMKEVKSSKSYDSMELAAKITTLPHLGQLIRPIQTLLLEKVDLKTVKKIDELLRRIGLGATQNVVVKDRDVLIFCYEVVQQVYAAAAEAGKRPAIEDYKIRKYLIQMKSANKSGNKGATTSYTFKLVKFALELVRSVLQRHEDLKTPANVAGFLPIIGDGLIGGQEEVQMAASRLMTAIIKVPAPKIAENASVYASEAVKIIRAAPSTTTELAQAALKLVSAIVRDRPTVRIKENDMAYILKRLKPDLEEPDRQGVIFNFLKAVLSRKVVIAEVYEIMDTVAAIMVTNQTRSARDLARGIYFQFMMDYPQGTNRLTKQIGFLVKNLEYQYTEGRQSVLELLHLLLSKTSGELVQELSSMLFVPLVMMMVNDDSPECREMAGALINKILQRSDEERLKNFVSLMRSWLEQSEQPLLRRIALQCWTMYIGNGEAPIKETTFLFKRLAPILKPAEHSSEEWELLYYCLQAFAKLCEIAPTTALSAGSKVTWANIFRCLIFPHAWVKLSAARLVGLLFADVGSTSSKTESGLSALPLYSSGGLELLEDEMHQLCNASLRIMRFQNVTEQLVSQTARNLIFLGRCYGANNALWTEAAQNKTVNGATKGTSDEEVDQEDDEEEEEEDDDQDAEEATSRTALAYLLSRLSAIVRRDAGALSLPTLASKTGALQVTAAIANVLSVETLTPSLDTILLPLYVLTDASIPAPRTANPSLGERYQALVALAQEIMSLLQKKLGTGVYVNVMGKVQERVRGKREDRRRKRRIEAVAAPEKWAKDKKRRQDVKKVKRKEKSEEARGRRRGW